MFREINKKVCLLGNLGTAYSGLATVGYRLCNGDGTTYQARTTTAVTEVRAGTGVYRVEVANSIFTADLDGYVEWDTGGTYPAYAYEDIHITATLDTNVGSRSTVAAIWAAVVDSSGVTLLLSRISQALGFSANGWVKVDVEDWKNAAAPAMTGDAFARLGSPAGASVSADVAAVKSDTAAVKTDVETSGVVVAAASKTGYALTAGEHTAIAGDVQTGLTAQGYTTARAAKLDELDAASALATRTGTAQAGAAGSITLDAGASGVNDFYVGQWVVIASGAGAGQSRLITGYVGSTKVATVHAAWKTQPSNTSVFYLLAAADIQGVVLADTATTLTDKSGFALTAGEHSNIAADTQTGMTAQGYTTTRAGYLDTLSGLVQAVWDKATSALTTNGSIGKLLSSLTITGGKVDVNDKTGFALTSTYDPAKTAAQAGDAMALTSGERTALTAVIWNALTSGMSIAGSVGKLIKDYLDTAISTRLATSSYTAPDNATIAATKTELDAAKAKIDNLPADPASESLLLAAVGTPVQTNDSRLDNLDTPISTRQPDDGEIAAILAAIAALPTPSAIASEVWAWSGRTLDNWSTIVTEIWASATDSPGVTKLLTRLSPGRATKLDNLDAPVSSRFAEADWVAPDNAGIAAIEANTNLIGSAQAMIASPMTPAGAIRLVKGDSYRDADGRAIKFARDNTWPDLTDATVHLVIGDTVTVTGQVADPGVVFEPASADTAKLDGSSEFAVVATLPGPAATVTLKRGTCNCVTNPVGAAA